MKLTKGKISKLYNKKKQTAKKFKVSKKSKKTNTFRKRKPLNLNHKTLKKIYGGLPDSPENIEENVVTPNTDTPVVPTEQVETQSPSLNSLDNNDNIELNPELNLDSDLNQTDLEPVSNEIPQPETQPVEQIVEEEPISNPIQEMAETPILEKENDNANNEVVPETPENQEIQQKPENEINLSVFDQDVDTNSDIGSDTDIEEPDSDSITITDTPANINLDNSASSFDDIAKMFKTYFENYIDEKINNAKIGQSYQNPYETAGENAIDANQSLINSMTTSSEI